MTYTAIWSLKGGVYYKGKISYKADNIFHKKTLAKKNLADPKNRQMEWIKLVCQNREWIDIHGYPR